MVVVVVAMAGCLEGTPDPTGGNEVPPSDLSAHYVPAGNDSDGLPDYLELPARISKLAKVVFGEAPGGNGVWLWNDRAYLSTGSSDAGLVIFDISDPTQPKELGRLEGQYARDVDILNYGDRTVAVIAAGGPLVFYDVTNPAEIVELARFPITAHNIAVHRPGFVVYNSRSLGDPPGAAEILDASNPDDIRMRVWSFERTAADGTPVANTGCHDVTVYPDLERAYCAAITQTLIWDVKDPLNPRILSTIDNPLINIHHSAFLMHDHKTLVLGDEYGGAILYACYGHVESPVASVSTPTGAMWFYDVSGPAPVLLSWLSPPPVNNPPPGTCTAHFGSEIGGSGMIAYGWYNAGTLLVDATNPMMPHLVQQEQSGGSVWDARYYRGYVFTGDGGGGLGVLRPE